MVNAYELAKRFRKHQHFCQDRCSRPSYQNTRENAYYHDKISDDMLCARGWKQNLLMFSRIIVV